MDDPRVVARYLIRLLTVPGDECLWWSADVAVGGAGRLWVGSLEQHGGVGQLCVTAHRFGYALRYGIDALEVTLLLGHGCANALCQRIDPDHVRPWTHADTQRAARTQPQADGGPEDAGAPVAHPGVPRLLFEELDGGRVCSIGRVTKGQARR